jgi:hypothetical protein
MTDRPVIEHGGRRYLRHGRTWVDTSTNLTVVAGVSHQLDSKARTDPAFWNRCRQRDFADDPRNRGKTLWIPAHDRPQAPISRAAIVGHGSLKHRRRRREDFIKWSLKRGEVTLTCDVGGGWRPTERSWCFRESAKILLPSDTALRVTIGIVEDTWGQSRRSFPSDSTDVRDAADEGFESTPPHFDRTETTVDGMVFVALDAVCSFEIPLLDEDGQVRGELLPWARGSDHWSCRWTVPEFWERPSRHQGVCMSRPFRAEVEGVLRGPQRLPIGAQYERDTPFPSAGLPSLGKRK